MAFYIQHRQHIQHHHQQRHPGRVSARRASPWEVAAEEFINGLLCHYEPPENRFQLEGVEVDYPDIEIDPYELQRPPSILKTSRSFEQKQRHKNKVRFTGVSQKQGGRGIRHGQRPRFLKKLACRKGHI